MFAHHVAGFAVMEAGVAGAPLTAIHLSVLVPQPLLALTQTVLVVNVPNVTLTALVPCPLLIVAEGTVHANVTPACEGHV